MTDVPTVRFAVKLNVVDCGVRFVQCSLKGLGVRRDCEYSSTRRDGFIVGSGRSSVEDDGIYNDLISGLRQSSPINPLEGMDPMVICFPFG